MSEKDDRPKPPPRRTGRTLGGGAKKTAPPPPPAAELTPEQIATERAAHQGEPFPAAASEPQSQPASHTAPVEESALDRHEALPEAAQTTVQLTVEAAPNAPARGAGGDQSNSPTVTAHEPRRNSDGEPAVQQVPSTDPTPQSAALTVPSVQPNEQAVRYGSASAASTMHSAPSFTEVAIRSTGSSAAGGTAFPAKTVPPESDREQTARPEAAPSEGASWTHGPGRPKGIPETAVVLNQRIITRESLDSSVPATLRLKRRIKRFALDNELDHLPLGDIVAVAMDEWLTTRGF
ncbi:hypothetical protein [Streptomyces umbrinus]|uniref:hypothetical protein n=1 Tax=Streptomyces umbrinus TaxID=67370 RepID=UPI0033DBA57D